MTDEVTDAATNSEIPGEAERRLHPMSWLFTLVQQLKQFVVPLLALLVFGQRGSDDYPGSELWPLVGVGALVVLSLWQYATYRYGVQGDSLIVRSGVLERSLRVIPFARIHNVALQQSVLHRIFDVAEVRLESAGGKKPEAQMRVLKLSDALALEALVRRRGAHSPAGVVEGMAATATDHEPLPTPLLSLPLGEVLRLGLVSNRGLIVVGAAFAGAMQFNRRLIPTLFEDWGQSLFGWAGQHHFGPGQYVLAALALFTLLVLVLRLLSMLFALLQYYGFNLSEQGRRLTVERGLLARWRTSASRRRIQAWTLREGLMHRLLKRRSLDVDTAVAEDQDTQRALREIAPIATPEACAALIDHLLPKADWAHLQWQRLPLASWWRLFLPGAAFAPLLAAALCWRFGAWGALALLWLPWAVYKARQRAARAAYAVGDALVAVREGWWSRHWRFAELDKLQALQLTRGPIDRRCGTSTLWLDTAGAGAMSPPLRIRFLPEADARALHDRIAGALARRPLRW